MKSYQFSILLVAHHGTSLKCKVLEWHSGPKAIPPALFPYTFLYNPQLQVLIFLWHYFPALMALVLQFPQPKNPTNFHHQKPFPYLRAKLKNDLFHPYPKFSSVQFSSVAQSCPTLCDPMNHSTPGLPVHHQLPEFTQTHVHRVSDAIQPSPPLSSPSPPAPNPSQHQSLF